MNNEEKLKKEEEKQLEQVDIDKGQKSLLSITWPIFIDLSLHFLTLVINMIMVGRVSVESVAELTVGNQVFDLGFIIFNFINVGICVVTAQSLGANNMKLVRRLIHMGIGVNLILGAIVSLGILGFAPFIIDLMNVPASLAQSSQRYLMILSLCFIPEALLLVCAAILRAYSCTRDAMYISIIINIVTVVGNAMFLFGIFGAPVIGVEGVAISTVVGRVVGCLLIIPLTINRTKIKIIPRFLFVFRKKIFGAILNIGIPGAGENLSWHMQYMVMTSYVGTLGAIALATHGIYFQMVLVMMIFAISIAMGTEILIAHYAGALKLELAYKQLLRSVKIGMIATILITFSMPLGTGEFIISKFTSSPEVLAMAAPMFILTVFQEPGRILNIIIINSLRATGDSRFPLIMALISMWGVSIPVGLVLAFYFDLGLLGIWIGFTCDEWVRGIAMFIRWKSKRWQKIATENYYKTLNNKNSYAKLL